MTFLSINTVDYIVVACAGKNAALLFRRQRLRRYWEDFNKSRGTKYEQASREGIGELLKQEFDEYATSTGIWKDDAPQHMRRQRRGKDPDHEITFRRRHKMRHSEQTPSSLGRNAQMTATFETLHSFRIQSTPKRNLNSKSASALASSFSIPPPWSWAHPTSFPSLALPMPIIINRCHQHSSKYPFISNCLQTSQNDVQQRRSQKSKQLQKKETGCSEDEARRPSPKVESSEGFWQLENHISLEPGVAWMSSPHKQYNDTRDRELMLPPFVSPLHDHIIGMKILKHRAWRLRPVEFLMPDPISEFQHECHKEIKNNAEKTIEESSPDFRPRGRCKVTFVDPCKRQLSRRRKNRSQTWKISASQYDDELMTSEIIGSDDPLPLQIMQRVAESIVRRKPGCRYNVGTSLPDGVVEKLIKESMRQARCVSDPSSALGYESEEWDPGQVSVSISDNKYTEDPVHRQILGYESEECDLGRDLLVEDESEDHPNHYITHRRAPDQASSSGSESVEWNPCWMVEGACT